MNADGVAFTAAETERLTRRALRLAHFTVVYNVAEGQWRSPPAWPPDRCRWSASAWILASSQIAAVLVGLRLAARSHGQADERWNLDAGCDDLLECADSDCCLIPFASLATDEDNQPSPSAGSHVVQVDLAVHPGCACRDRRRVACLARRPRAQGLGMERSRSHRPCSLRFVATLQPDAHFGRILAAYGGVFVAGLLAWGMIADGFRPDRWDIAGALICLTGVAVIMYTPRPGN